MKENSIGLLELKAEKTKLEGDRAVLSEKLVALRAESDKSQQQLIMIAGAIQALDQLITRTEPDVVELGTDLSDDKHGPGPDEEK
tara:strand:- start:30 stop:284 length:255 start_codon:yes stop_codon:yes gene_type:complete